MKDLDSLLREDARTPIADDGFTRRVMGALPARPRATLAWLPPALILGSAALGSVLAVALAPAGGSLLQGFVDITSLRALTPASITAAGACLALLLSSLVFAVYSE